jgi:hypothetical protein
MLVPSDAARGTGSALLRCFSTFPQLGPGGRAPRTQPSSPLRRFDAPGDARRKLRTSRSAFRSHFSDVASDRVCQSTYRTLSLCEQSQAPPRRRLASGREPACRLLRRVSCEVCLAFSRPIDLRSRWLVARRAGHEGLGVFHLRVTGCARLRRSECSCPARSRPPTRHSSNDPLKLCSEDGPPPRKRPPAEVVGESVCGRLTAAPLT